MDFAQTVEILALNTEVDSALDLADDEDTFREDWRLQRAAERTLERLLHAADLVSRKHRIDYFGAAGLVYLRDVQHQLVHDPLNVDVDTLWNALIEDVPEVRERMLDDVAAAWSTVRAKWDDEDQDAQEWLRQHRHRTADDNRD